MRVPLRYDATDGTIFDADGKQIAALQPAADRNHIGERITAALNGSVGWHPISEFTNDRQHRGPHALLCDNGEVHAAMWSVGRYNPRTKDYEWVIKFCDHSGSGLTPVAFRPLTDLLTIDRPQASA